MTVNIDRSFDLILKHVSKYISLDAEEIDFFKSLLKPRELKRKEFLVHKGEVCKYESFVVEGCLRIYNIDKNGFEHIVMFAIEDWWTGDPYSFITQTPAAFNIDALEDSVVLQISKDNSEKLYKDVPKFERFFRIKLQNAFIAGQQRIMQNLSFTAAERYEQFKKKYPDLEQRIPQKQIAAYLGITPEYLSMMRSKNTKSRIS